MDFSQALESLVRPDDRRVLVIGSTEPHPSWAGAAGREFWRLQAAPIAQIPPPYFRCISGKLLSLPVGVLPVRAFDFIAVLGDLPFGADLHLFLNRLKFLLAPTGRICLRTLNPLSSQTLLNHLQGGSDLQADGAFTPSQMKASLAVAELQILTEMSAYLPNDPVQTALSSFGDAEALSIAEKTFLVCPTTPVVDKTHSLPPSEGDVRTSIVILTYNSSTTIDDCLNSVLASIREDDEIVVVDNASKDETVEKVETFAARDPRVRPIQNEQNLGFSAGSNVGILASRGSFIALLNPDTIVCPGWIESLQAPLADPGVGMVGPLSDRIAGDQFLGHHLAAPSGTMSLAEECRSNFPGQFPETKLLIGLCVMTRRDILQKVGLLDESLFLGSDDLELSWRLRTHHLRLLISKETFVSHLGGVSFSSLDSAEKSKLLFESTETLLAKIRTHHGWNPPDQLLWGVSIIHK